MIAERAHLLADLLQDMRERDGGFFPDAAWLEIHRNFAIPYVEIVLPRRRQDGQIDVFLSRRDKDDANWPGQPWHIPGGIWRVGETREGACRSVAQREIGIPATFCSEVMTFKWPDHPYANPISHVCICDPATEVEETS